MLSPPTTQNQKKTSPESLAQGDNAGLHCHHEIQIMEFQMSVENTNSPIIATICSIKKNTHKKRVCVHLVITKNTLQQWFSS